MQEHNSKKESDKNRVEQSIIGIVLFSTDMIECLVNIEVDEKRKYILIKSGQE